MWYWYALFFVGAFAFGSLSSLFSSYLHYLLLDRERQLKRLAKRYLIINAVGAFIGTVLAIIGRIFG